MSLDAETKRQQEYVKESLTRAINEVRAAKKGEQKIMAEDEFIEGLRAEGDTMKVNGLQRC